MSIKAISIIIIGGVIITVLGYAAFLIYYTWPISEHSIGKAGVFGDSFGILTSLFSGLAFSGMIITILLQREELSLQRKELELTRNEIKGQKGEMQLQNKTLLKQSFESTFFQLLGLQQEIINSIDLIDTTHKTTTSGRDCIKVFYERLQKTWDKNRPHLAGSNEIERINLTYRDFFDKHQQEIGHYFRSLYHIVKLVDNSDVQDKRLYTNLIRAQLSSFELTLLFYNCISELGRDKFKPYIEKYSLFKNMPQKLLLDPPKHIDFYAESAYK